jgi:hypothetical protein
MSVQDMVTLADARPGMRLAAPVTDLAGQVLVPAGAELTESLMQALRRREIAAICVEREVGDDPAAREARLAGVRTAVDHLFRAAGNGMATRTLYQCIVDFRSETKP